MPIAKTPNEVWPYILKAERNKPKKERTVFKLKFLNSAERATIDDTRYQSGAGTASIETAIRGLVGWENFNDGNGSPVVFKKQLVSGEEVCCQENLDYLDRDNFIELVAAISNNNRLTEDEVKNLL